MNTKPMTPQETAQRCEFLKDRILKTLTFENERYEEKLISAFFSIAGGSEELDEDTVITFQNLWYALKDATELKNLTAKLKANEGDATV